MSTTYFFGSAANMTAMDGRKLLLSQLDLTLTEPGSFWAENKGVTVMIDDYVRRAPSDVETEFAGFSPKWGMRMKLEWRAGEETLELGCRTMVKVVDCILRHTTEDLYFSSEWERLLVTRRAGEVAVRDDFDHYLGDPRLVHLSMPFKVQKMQP
jgi:hypothetical protein